MKRLHCSESKAVLWYHSLALFGLHYLRLLRQKRGFYLREIRFKGRSQERLRKKQETSPSPHLALGEQKRTQPLGREAMVANIPRE